MQNFEGHQNCMIGATVTAILVAMHFYTLSVFNVLLIPFTKYKSQINQLQKDSSGKSNVRTLFSEFAILAHKWS